MTPSPWPARVAVDGRASLEGGARAVLGADTTWVARTQDSSGALSPPVEATPSASASAPGISLPQLRYRGMAESLGRSLGEIVACAHAEGLAIWLLAVLPGILRRGRGDAVPEHADEEAQASLGVTRLWTFVATSAVLGAALVLYLSWGERDDIFLLLPPWTWRAIAATAFAVGASVPLLREGRGIAWPWSPATWLRGAIQDRRFVTVALGLVLFGTAVLRLIHIAWYPVEDDEAVCMQAAFAVADHGAPGFAPDVYYTRSPGYHYLLGGVVRLLGHNLYAIRLPSVAFAVATVYLMYLVGARLLGSRWTGLVSGALLAVHPLAIFVGHLGRFYQQQQFFCLLTAYFFCQGFLGPQKASARLFTIGAFLAACVSQELSVVMVVPLACAYLIFAEKKDRWSTIAFWSVGACAAVAFVIDIATYFTVCLTKVEGIAPALDATPSPHFANPVHFFTLFVGHSRLHLALSLVLVAGMPRMLASKSGNTIALLMILFGGVVGVNLLLATEAIRYLYWLFP